MKSHLQIKYYALSQEMTYIRRKEQKWKERARAARLKERADAAAGNINSENGSKVTYCDQNFWTMRNHRNELKVEARHTHLARMAIKGTAYSAAEPICYGTMKGYGSTEPDWSKIEDMISRFTSDEWNSGDIMQRFSEWLDAAKAWYAGNSERIQQMWEENAALREQQAADPVYQGLREQRNTIARGDGIRAHEARQAAE